MSHSLFRLTTTARLPAARADRLGTREEGRLSYSKVRALTRVATVESQAELCGLAESVPAERLGRAVAAWLGQHETPAETEARHHAARSFTSRLDVDGMAVGSYRLPPAEAAKITTPVDTLVVERRPATTDVDAYTARIEPRWPLD